MKYLISILVLLLPSLLFSQEQITDTFSKRYQKEYIRIIDGQLGEEPFTAYLDYFRLFIDFKNEEINDYAIPYTFTCWPRNIYLDDQYFYIHGQSTLVINLASRKMHDHFTFSKDWYYRNAHATDGLDITTLENDANQFRYGVYDPDAKEKTLSNPHSQVFSHDGLYYFLDSESNETIIGRFDIQNWTEETLYQGEELVYLGQGLFRDSEGYVYEEILDSNPIKTCIPQDILAGDIIPNRYFNQDNYTIIETYDSTHSLYKYYIGDGCDYRSLYSSNYFPLSFEFYNESYFGFKSGGKYLRLEYKDNLPSFLFSIASSEDYNTNDKWVMSGDTAYLFTRKYANNKYERQIIRFIPGEFIDPDEKKIITIFPDDSNIIRRKLNDAGNIEFTFNSEDQGAYMVTIDPNGNEIATLHLFDSWYNDYDEKNYTWSSYRGGHLRRAPIKQSENYRIDRVEDGLVLTDTMLISPYIDNEIEATIKTKENNPVLQLFDVNTSNVTEVIIPSLDINTFDTMIRVGDEIWIIAHNTSNEDIIFKYEFDGSAKESISFDINKIIYHDHKGILFSSSLGQFPSYLFHYNGENVVQLSDYPTASVYKFVVENKHYLISTFQEEIRLYEYVPDLFLLNNIETFNGHLKTPTNNLHNSLQSSKLFSIFENIEYSSTIKVILFEGSDYKIKDFDLEDSTFVLASVSYPINGGYIYSIQDNFTNVYVDSNGVSNNIPINLEEDFLIRDIHQAEESVYLFVSSYYDVYVLKCDDEIKDCEVLKNFNKQWCQYSQFDLIGSNGNEVYFSASGIDPIETVWVLNTANDEMRYYNENENSQIQYFKRRDFFQNGYVYFTAAKSDQIHQLFRLKISDGPNATNDNIVENTFNVYPNPATSNTRIASKINLAQISIYDSRGIKIIQGQFDIDGGYTLPKMNSGYYIIHAQGKDGKRYVSKLVLIN